VKTIVTIVVLLFATFCPAQSPAPVSDVELTVKSLSGETTRLGPLDFSKLPRVHRNAISHDGKSHDYDGVSLRDVLIKAGAPTGDALRGKEMADYVIAQGADGYSVVFSLAELDPEFGDQAVVVADKMDGQPLSSRDGPLRLVVPGDKRQARWVRMLRTITIMKAP
jgi:DMSO/TMAO reductase YedYZ molybdopterin-dependent catalytic subunit